MTINRLNRFPSTKEVIERNWRLRILEIIIKILSFIIVGLIFFRLGILIWSFLGVVNK